MRLYRFGLRRMCALALAALLSAAVLPLSGCRSVPQKYSKTYWDVFDTVTVLTGYAQSQAEWDAEADAIHADLLHFHQLFDIYDSYSGVTSLADVNAAAGQGSISVEHDTVALLGLAKQLYTLTDGKCNVAGGAVLALWHTAREAAEASPETAALPSAADLHAAAQHCNMEDLIVDLNANTVELRDPDMLLDVGAVAKGYATELAAQAAEARGVQSALLNVGGNLRAIGSKPGGAAWTVGVENPWPDAAGQWNLSSYVAMLELKDGESLVTSGDYQRYFTVDGVRYSHLIDPDTLYPARYVSSVTVLCQGGGLADGLSTGLFCQPVADGEVLANATNGLEALWLLADGSRVQSAGWAERERKD